ncbi:LCCL domain-containing protein [Dactylosporangium sp. NPDC051485]|uniref:LCCL domain-containing protein n=1 Tax=Dactylosporangium sp. NPDC051485 TaxID=3154846 RepID=UPI00344A2D20
MSGAPSSGGGLGGGGAAAPVSPAFSAAPVSGHPVASPGNGAVTGGRVPAGPVGVGPAGGGGRAASGGAAGGASPAEQGRGKGVIAAAVVILVLVLGLGAWGVVYAIGKLGGGSGVAVDREHPGDDWSSTAETYDSKPGTTVAYRCAPNGTIITVWGSGPYTTDSSVCTAAVHAGKITLDAGGRVVIKIVAGPNSYEGTTRHDIATSSYNEFPWAFEFVG